MQSDPRGALPPSLRRLPQSIFRKDEEDLSDFAAVFADLTTVQEHVVENHAGHHRFANGDRADADAGVVAALGDDFDGLA